MDKTVKGLELGPVDGKNLKVLIVHTRWNKVIVDALVNGAVKTLHDNSVKDIEIRQVAGAYELPLATQTLMSTGKFDACISIGVLIKGSTMHFEYIADATSQGLMRVGLDLKLPVIFGVLTCLNDLQAQQRAGIGHDSHNHGIDWALTAIEMANLVKEAKN
jgi:6,7-dimethyl-8-ribityllumazine synthase